MAFVNIMPLVTTIPFCTILAIKHFLKKVGPLVKMFYEVFERFDRL